MKEDTKLTLMIILGIISAIITLTFIIRAGTQFIINNFGLNMMLWISSFIIAIFISILLYFVSFIVSGICGVRNVREQ
jgi:hypothetical protein